MERPYRFPSWVVSFVAALLGGAIALLGQFVLLGEYKNKVETMEKETAAYMQFMGEMKTFVGSQTQINERILADMEKLAGRIDRHIENGRK